MHSSGIWLNCALGHISFVLRQAVGRGPWCHGMSISVGGVCLVRWMMSTTTWHRKEGRKEDNMNALTKPHGSCRGPSGSDMHTQTKPN